MPKVRQEVTLPDGRTTSRMSRGPGLKDFVADNTERLRETNDKLKELERTGGVWADDAAVVRGYLCALTAEGAQTEHEDPGTLYRSLAARPVEIRLETWTRQSLLALDSTAGNNPFLDSATTDDERVAIAFAGYLILHTVKEHGIERASKELETIRKSKRVSDEVLTFLQETIDRWPDHAEPSRAPALAPAG